MGSTWLALRADLWVRWRAMAGLALLLGLIGGVMLAAIPVTLLLAIVVAAGPGWAAARVRPASVLRSE